MNPAIVTPLTDGKADATPPPAVARCRDRSNPRYPFDFSILKEGEVEPFLDKKIESLIGSDYDYIVFLDGDCIAQRDFVAAHRRLAEPGRVVTGSRILLSPELTQQVLTGMPILDRGLACGAITARGADRCIQVAWTLADLAGQDKPGPDQVAAALEFRDRRAA